MIAINRISSFVALVASTIGMRLVACDSNLGTPAGAPEAGPSNACEDAGYGCMNIKAGCGSYFSAPFDCGSTGLLCCTRYAAFMCGPVVCASGNTCDSNYPGYCSGANTPPSCGTLACLGACTCAGTSCACPACVPTAERCTIGGQSTGAYYKCDPELAPDAGPAAFPADAGTCTVDAVGNLCCVP
ncbi:MAG: hypothetical protein ACRELY_11110 [Polyangiaceae bacterium]